MEVVFSKKGRSYAEVSYRGLGWMSMNAGCIAEGDIGFYGPARQGDLIHQMQAYEPDIAGIRWQSVVLNGPRGNAAENDIAEDICALLESFSAGGENSNYRSLWFRVPRGTIDDWMPIEKYRDYAEMYDNSDEDVETGWRKEWSEWFPDDWYWHTLETNSDNGWALVAVDGRVVIEVRPDEKAPYENPRLTNLLEKLRSIAAGLVDMGLRGTYPQLLTDELPPHCRFGFIRRNKWWELLGRDNLFDDGKIEQEEARELANLVSSQPESGDIGRLPELSAGRYFEALKGAYAAAGFLCDADHARMGFSSNDGRAWYVRFGDARDESILELDQDSPEAFEAWFHDGSRFFNHTFEVIAGSSISRVHLSPRHDSGGWYFVLSGAITWRVADIARMWRYLNANGFPTYLVEAQDIARMLLGQDDLLVVPFNESIWYQGGEHFGRHVVTCVHLPEDGADLVVPDVEWLEEPVSELVELSVDLDSTQVGLLLRSLDFYSRMWIGQYEEVEWRMRLNIRDLQACQKNQVRREKKWLEMRNLVLPELRNLGLSGSYGIWNPSVCDRAQSAYDMQQVIRHAWAWRCNPAGGIGVNFDEPWIRGLLPSVGCSCSGEGEETHCLIRLLPAHARPAREALEVSRLLAKGNIREVMMHFTDNKDALAIASEIEQLMPSLVDEGEGVSEERLEELIHEFEVLTC